MGKHGRTGKEKNEKCKKNKGKSKSIKPLQCEILHALLILCFVYLNLLAEKIIYSPFSPQLSRGLKQSKWHNAPK